MGCWRVGKADRFFLLLAPSLEQFAQQVFGESLRVLGTLVASSHQAVIAMAPMFWTALLHFPADEWILILRIKPNASGGDWVTIVGDNTINTNNPYIGTPTRFAWAHSRASDENTGLLR